MPGMTVQISSPDKSDATQSFKLVDGDKVIIHRLDGTTQAFQVVSKSEPSQEFAITKKFVGSKLVELAV